MRQWGEPFKSGLCHCADCRKVTGTAFLAYADWRPDMFRYTGEVMSILPNPKLFALPSTRRTMEVEAEPLAALVAYAKRDHVRLLSILDWWSPTARAMPRLSLPSTLCGNALISLAIPAATETWRKPQVLLH